MWKEKRTMSEPTLLQLTGRCSDGAGRDGGRLYHAVPTPNLTTGHVGGRALCGAEPGRLSGWSWQVGEKVTCPRCLKRLAKAGGNHE